MKKNDDVCIIVTCYSDVADTIRIGERFIISGKQKARGGRYWQIVLKPFAKKEKK